MTWDQYVNTVMHGGEWLPAYTAYVAAASTDALRAHHRNDERMLDTFSDRPGLVYVKARLQVLNEELQKRGEVVV